MLSSIFALALTLGASNPYETNLRAFGNVNIQSRPATAVAGSYAFILALQDDGVIVRHGYTPYITWQQTEPLIGVKAIETSDGRVVARLDNDSLVLRDITGKVGVPIPRIPGLRAFKTAGAALLALTDSGILQCWSTTEVAKDQCRIPRIEKRVRSIEGANNRFFAILEDSSLVEWTSSLSSDTMIPPLRLSRGIVAVAGVGGTSYALESDGRVRSWKGLQAHQGPIDSVDLREVLRIAGASDFAVLQTKDGTVYRTPRARETTLQRVPELDGSSSFAASQYEVAGLKSDGTITTMRFGSSGAPTLIPRLGTVLDVFGNSRTSVAIRDDGVAQAWGYDNWVLSGPFRSGSYSGSRALLVRRDGTLHIEGTNRVEIFGDTIPGGATVPAGLSRVAHVAALDRCNVVVREDSTTVVWGDTSTTTGCGILRLPASIPGLERIRPIGGGLVGLFQDGTIRSWGVAPNPLARMPMRLDGWATFSHSNKDALAIDSQGHIVTWFDRSLGLDSTMDRSIVWKDVGAVNGFVFALGQDGILRSVGGAKSAPWIEYHFPRLDSLREINRVTLFGFVATGGPSGRGPTQQRGLSDLHPGLHEVLVQDIRGRTVWSGRAPWNGHSWELPVTQPGIFFARPTKDPSKVMRLIRMKH